MPAETFREVLGDRAVMDADLRAREGRAFDSLTPDMQRAAFIHARRVIHEVTLALQHARDGHSTFRNDRDLLAYIERLVWTEG